jgi:phage-related protein
VSDYLPPVVAKLQADIGDFLAKMGVAKGAMRDLTNSGSSINVGKNLGGGTSSGDLTGWLGHYRAALDEAKKTSGAAGDESGRSFGSRFSSALSGIGGSISGALASAMSGVGAMLASQATLMGVGMAVAIAAGLAILPVLMATIVGTAFVGIALYANKGTASVKTAFHDMAGSIRDSFKGVTASTVPYLIAGMQALAIYVKSLAPLFKQAFGAVGPLIAPMLSGFEQFTSGILPGMITMLQQSGPAFQIMANAIGDIGRAFGQMLTNMSKNGGLTASAQFFKFLLDIALSLLPLIGTLGNYFAKMFVGLSPYMPAVKSFFQELGRVIIAVLPIVKMLASVVGVLLLAALTIVTTALHVLNAILSGLQGPIRAMTNAVMTFVRGAAKELTAWATHLPQIFTAMGHAIQAATMAVVHFLISQWQTAYNAVKGYVTNIKNAVVAVFVGIVAAVMVAMVAIKSAIVTGFTAALSAATTALNAIKNAVMTAFNAALAVVRTVINTIVSAVRTGFTTVVSTIRSVLSNVKSAILGAFAGAAGWLVAAGASIITGLAHGMASAAGSAISAAKNVAGSVAKSIGGFFGIHSPSRLMMDYGGFIVQGLVDGLALGNTKAGRAGTTLSAALAGGLRTPTYGSGGLALAGARGGGTTVQINISAGAVMYNEQQFANVVQQALTRYGARMTNQNLSFQSVRGRKVA